MKGSQNDRLSSFERPQVDPMPLGREPVGLEPAVVGHDERVVGGVIVEEGSDFDNTVMGHSDSRGTTAVNSHGWES